jgi:hypothetical protein
MLKLPMITPRSGRFVIGILLCMKLALLLWNAAVFDGTTYDSGHHSDRALVGGLRPSKLAYDPPPYYLPALLLKRPANVPLLERHAETSGEHDEVVQPRLERASRSEKKFRERLLTLLRYSNVFWLGLFYLGWICYAFPRLLGGFQPWFLSSLLLLAMPGYQKLGVMTHPDNMFAGCAALAICGWLLLRERWRGSGYGLKHLVGFALAIGLLALTRPFAVVPVAVLSVVAAVYVLRLTGPRWKELLPKLALVGVLVGVMSSGWYIYRWQQSGELTNAYRTGYIAQFEKRRESFSFSKYYLSFKLADLLDNPSRQVDDGGESVYPNTPLADSFFSLLHSEIWGDQWQYFSGPKGKDYKVWPKRLIAACALLVPPIMIGLGGMLLWDMQRRAREQLRATKDRQPLQRLLELASMFEKELVLLAITTLGAALFVYWQAGPALLPGNNSTVKFIYIATLFPPALALIFSRPLAPVTFNLLAGYFWFLYLAAFPFAMYWPK